MCLIRLPRVIDALDRAFYLSFGNFTPTGKRWLVALDVSGSMEGVVVAGVPGLTPRVASSAIALVTAAVCLGIPLLLIVVGTLLALNATEGPSRDNAEG